MAEQHKETDIEIPSILLPCVVCNRTFRPEALAKHVKVCEKSLVKRRKVFDSSKQRIQGTDLAEFLPVLPLTKKPEKSPVRKIQSKWKEKHTELVSNIRAAREPSGDVPQPVKTSDHEQCPYCQRCFGPKAFDRHLEWCKEQQVRIQPKSPASLQAKERWEARTKYRAPLLNKSKRTLTKEKYSPHSKVKEPLPANCKTSSPNIISPPASQTRNFKEITGSPGSNFVRGTSFRGSKRVSSPSKKNPVSPKSNEKSITSSNVTTPSSDKSKSLEDKEELFSRSCTITSIHPTENNKKTNVGTSSRKNSSSDDSYDPFVSAERQLMKLLGISEDQKRNESPVTKSPLVLSSPSSAFAKFSPNLTCGSSPSPENVSATIPPPSSFEDLEAQCSSPPLIDLTLRDSLVKDKNRNPISLSSLSLCSSISIESVDLNRNGFRRTISNSAKAPEQRKEVVFQRSVSLVDSPRKVRDLSKGRLKMEDLLYGSSQVDNDRYFGSPIPKDHFDDQFKVVDDNDNSSNISLHRAVSDEETFNAEQDLLKSISEYENLFKSDSPVISTSLESLKLFPSLGSTRQPDFLDSSEIEKNSMNEAGKSGPDSAYNSLNRKSSLENMNIDPGTRSSSECESSPSSLKNSAARFCHECGNRYPVTEAKFCCNCGVRRLVI